MVAAALALLAAGCIPDVKEPDVKLAGVRLGGIGLEGGLIHVDLQVMNPNDFAIEADGFTYDIELADPAREDEWIELADGRYEEDVRIEAGDSALISLPVRFSFDRLGGLMRSVLRTGTFEYRVQGSVSVEEPIQVSVPYRKRGTVAVLGD